MIFGRSSAALITSSTEPTSTARLDVVHAVELRGDLAEFLGADRGAELVEFGGQGRAVGAGWRP